MDKQQVPIPQCQIHKGCLIFTIPKSLVPMPFLSIDCPIPERSLINQQKRDGNSYHCTIVNSTEVVDDCKMEEVIRDNVLIPLLEVAVLGLGKVQDRENQAFYLLVYHNKFNQIRKFLGLQPHPCFHVTLGFTHHDIHDADKGLQTLLAINPAFDVSLCSGITNRKVLECIETHYNHTDDKLRIMRAGKRSDWARCGETCARELIGRGNFIGHLLLDWNCENDANIKSAYEMYSAEIQAKFDEDNKFRDYLILRHNKLEMQMSSQDKFRSLLFVNPEDNSLCLHEMPRNFGWVIDGLLGGTSKIRNQADILALRTLGVKHMYFFLEKPYFDDLHAELCGLKIHYVHCLNGMVPTAEDMNEVLQAPNFIEGEPVFFGCLGGFGRTGTALACYLTKWGIALPSEIASSSMSSDHAVGYLRSVRPKSIENAVQLSFVSQFTNFLYKSGATAVKCPYPHIKFVCLVGLPGAGKSTFSELLSSCGREVVTLNQDQLGKKECEASLGYHIKNADLVILDRTNLSAKDRKIWLETAQLEPRQCLCIYLSTPSAECLDRITRRSFHPTIVQGGGTRIVKEAEAKMDIPTADEGFSDVVELADEEEVKRYLQRWNCSRVELNYPTRIDLFKFPRTEHLINLGSATADDLVVHSASSTYQTVFGAAGSIVEVTEKVDGCQLGFSMDENYKIKVQNRSHFVNSQSHVQFKYLDKWVSQHQDELIRVLEDTDKVLFGEWLYAKHSIAYSKLPDFFIAFDLYDKKTGLFLCRSGLEAVLRESTINIVPLLYRGVVRSEAQLLDFLKLKSQFSDSLLEGVYLKCNDGDSVKMRSKIVRSDFICGNQHWSKYQVQVNTIEKTITPPSSQAQSQPTSVVAPKPAVAKTGKDLAKKSKATTPSVPTHEAESSVKAPQVIQTASIAGIEISLISDVTKSSVNHSAILDNASKADIFTVPSELNLIGGAVPKAMNSVSAPPEDSETTFSSSAVIVHGAVIEPESVPKLYKKQRQRAVQNANRKLGTPGDGESKEEPAER